MIFVGYFGYKILFFIKKLESQTLFEHEFRFFTFVVILLNEFLFLFFPGEEMVQLLRHDLYKYPLGEKKKTNAPRPVPVDIERIEVQDLESARELVEREADASVRMLVVTGDNDRSVLVYFYMLLNYLKPSKSLLLYSLF